MPSRPGPRYVLDAAWFSSPTFSCMRGKRIAIVQSSYLPWKGYFDLIASVDEFVLFEDFQYTRRSWRNRNIIKTPQGTQWLTIPVVASPQRTTRISDVLIASPQWAERHLKTLRMAYSRAPFFSEIIKILEEEFGRKSSNLSDINISLIRRFCLYLGIETVLSTHRHYKASDHRQLRLRDICLQAGASVYVSGPAAKTYLDESIMGAAGIEVEWFDYSGYREYPQLWGPFVHEVSIVDLLFNQGPNAPAYMNVVGQPRAHVQQEPAREPSEELICMAELPS